MEIPPPPPAPPDAAIADLPLEKLGVEAENAMARALRLAIDAQDIYVGTEHVLLGVLGEEGSLGALALQSLGVTPEFVTKRLKSANRPVNPNPVRPIATTRLANALMQSMLRYTDTTVIDSGVLVDAVIEGNGIGGQILVEAGVTPQKWSAAAAALRTDPWEQAVGRFSPSITRLWTQRGVSRLRTDRLEKARADFLLLLGSATSDGEVGIAANNLAWTQLCTGDADGYGEALELAERAAAKIPDERYVRGTLAFAFIESGRIREGVDILVTDGIHGHDDWGTASRACVLAIGVARLGNRPYAEVLLNVAEQLEPPSALAARVREEIAKAPSSEPAAPASGSDGSVVAAVQSLRFHPKLKKHVLVLRGADRRLLATWMAAGAGERLRRLLASPTTVEPGKQEWIELLVAALRSRGASLSAITLDRRVADAFRCTISVNEGNGWSFELSPSDAAMIALSTGLSIRVRQELWAQYSIPDHVMKWNLGQIMSRIINSIFRRR